VQALTHRGAANNLSAMYTVGRGVTRSKRQAMRYVRMAGGMFS